MSDNQQKENQGSFWNTTPCLLAVLVTLITALVSLRVSVVSQPQPEQKKKCLMIKGNISYNSGRRIYHMPGDRDYKKTRIDPTRGERFFCTVAEAEASGWRRAPR